METVIDLQNNTLEYMAHKIACLVIFVSVTYLIFKHYGDKNSILEKAFGKIEFAILKIGLVFIAMSSLWSLVTNTAEARLLTIGSAVYFMWISMRFNKLFVKPSCSHKKEKKQN